MNGIARTIITDPDKSLAEVLRKQLLLTGTKVGCNKGECGACNVILNGKVTRSCITKMSRVPENSEIITIEGIGDPENLHPLQMAWMVHGGAQCGFCTPGFIVSAKGLLDENPDPTREEVRDWFQKTRNVCRCTGYIPLVDSVMTAAKILRGEITREEIWPKLPIGASIVGTNYIRPSAAAKVTGRWDFGADLGLQLPDDTLHAKLVQAKVCHANIISIDTSEAEKMPGVFKVVTHKDVKGNNRINGLVFEQNLGDGFDRPILADEKIFQYGDVIAIVLADTPGRAEAACEKVKFELEELPAYMTAAEAMKEGAIEIHPGTPNVYFTTNMVKGDEVEPIFEKCEYVVEDQFYVGRQPHLVLEPDVGFAYFNEEGILNIHSKSIALHFHAAMIAEGIGLPMDKLAIIQNPTGSTFGYKFSPTNEGLLAVATMATGRPVYLEYDMEQQITYTGKRAPFHVKLKLGADKDGKIQAMETDWTVDHGAYCEFGDLLTMRGSQFLGAGYDIPNIRGEGRTVVTNHTWAAAFRGYGAPQSMFASEVLVDELAEKMNMDPLELRYKNVYREGSTTPSGCAPEVICLPDMIDSMRPHYEEAKEKIRKKNKNSEDKRYGVGFSLLLYGCGLDGADSSEAWVELTKDGVTVGASWEDHGQGADMGVLAQAHEKFRPLNIEPEDIKLVMNDMNLTPNSGPAGGSRSTVLTGNAIANACDNLLGAMRKEDGSYKSYDEMLSEELPLRYNGVWTAPNTACDVATGQGDPFSAYMYGFLMTEVEVDVKTGKAMVEKFTIISDVGTIMNKLVVDGQIYGGLAQGIGLALTEVYDDVKKHTTLTKCGIPQVKDVPDDMELIYQVTKRPHSHFGSSGVGELPLSAPHASIINAIYNACGVRITNLPALPEKIKKALEELKVK
ncbi:MAG: molybdopterin-dependent oxidoreductase [Tissierellia bacterium]|nr:molybdopterin-dependent oxidoreductase [Tissierellia bacterium]